MPRDCSTQFLCAMQSTINLQVKSTIVLAIFIVGSLLATIYYDTPSPSVHETLARSPSFEEMKEALLGRNYFHRRLQQVVVQGISAVQASKKNSNGNSNSYNDGAVGAHQQQHPRAALDAHYRKCSREEIVFQWDNVELAEPSICDSTTPWRLAQLAYPDASVFFDVGANRGYTAAVIISLWSPGYAFNRASLFQAIKSDMKAGLTQNKENEQTVCGDEHYIDEPIVCPGQWFYGQSISNSNLHKSDTCAFRRNIRVYSFDGQSSHVKEQRDTIYRHFPLLHPDVKIDAKYSDVKTSWEYVHSAMTSAAHSNETEGYFTVSTSEAGKLVFGNSTTYRNEFEEVPANMVPVTTVDKFAHDRELKTVDFLKIDAEGADIDVVHGATATILKRGVKMISVECEICAGSESMALWSELDVSYGFDCYVNGPYDVLVKVTNCWDPALAFTEKQSPYPECSDETGGCPDVYRGEPRRRLSGNAYCVHRHRGRTLHAMFEELSLHKYYSAAHSRGHLHKDALIMASNVNKNPKKQFDQQTGELLWEDHIKEQYVRKTGRNATTGAKKWF